MITRPIGELFDFVEHDRKHRLKVVHHIGCGACYFSDVRCADKASILGFCSYIWRSDGKSVNFVEVKGGDE